LGDGVRRWVVTGTPGAGKTALVDALAARGHPTVREAATDVMAAYPPGTQPWESAHVLDEVVALQRRRELEAVPTAATHVVLDRSPVCTLALARHMGYDLPPGLAAELERIAREQPYERRVLYVEWLGFLTPTEVRRIDEAGTVVFDRIHRETYRELGFELVEVPVLPLAERVSFAESLIGPADRA
jgi:predicted ATPase